jgi:hypothetical protein
MTTPQPDPTLDQLRATTTLQEYRFRSQVPLIGPLIARFREIWNGVATKWYVRPLIQQQNEINQQLVAALAAQAASLRDVASRLAVDEARLLHQDARQQDHDGWLIELDHEQVALTRSQAELTARLIQVEQLLMEIEQRPSKLEPVMGADSERS